LEVIEQDFKKELNEAKAWYAELREKELTWIRDGKDPEAEFDKLYDVEPEVSGMNILDPLTPSEQRELLWKIGSAVAMGISLIVVIAGILLAIHFKKTKRLK
jgi:hypothetical protein